MRMPSRTRPLAKVGGHLARRGRARQPQIPVPGDRVKPSRPLRPYDSLLPQRRGPRTVVVLAGDVMPDDVVAFLEQFRGDSVHVVSATARPEWRLEEFEAVHHAAANLAEINWVMRFVGPIDILLDLAPASAANHETTWGSALLPCQADRGLRHLSTSGRCRRR